MKIDFDECKSQVDACVSEFSNWVAGATQDEIPVFYEMMCQKLSSIGSKCCDQKIWQYINALIDAFFSPVTITS